MKNILILTFATTFLFASSASALNITLADWVTQNRTASTGQGYWTQSNDGLTIVAGGLGSSAISGPFWQGWSATSGTSYDGWGAGTDSSTHGDTSGIMDSQYLRFGNSANQRKLDFMVVNNTGSDIILDGFSFTWQNPHANGLSVDYLAGPTAAAAAADSNLLGTDGAELSNQADIAVSYASNSVSTTSESLGTINDGDGATFRIIYTLQNTRGLDTLSINATAVPEVSHFGLLTGVIVLIFAARRRRG